MKYFVFFFIITASAFAEPVNYVKFNTDSSVYWGILKNDSIQQIKDAPWINSEYTEEQFKLNEVTLLPPVSPTKVLAIGLNFRSHSGNSGAAKPELFAKFPSSIQGGGDIRIPSDALNIHYEGELVIVIGQRTKNADIREAKRAIFGITIGNDISERNWQSQDLQWARAKGSDGFAPLGPFLTSGLDWSDLLISTYINGELRQSESTEMLIHSPEEIVAWVSKYITLEAGDVIFTGTPGRTQAVEDGDIVEVVIEGLGTLENTFIWDR